jgi:hypothetical protein
MSDGMVNIIENKILKNMAGQKIEYEGPIQEKIINLTEPNLLNWEKITFENED